MDKKGSGSGSTVFLGAVFIAVGLIWVMRNLGHIDFGIREWWPLILIGAGILNIVSHRDIFAFPGWLLVAVGMIFLLRTNNLVEWDYIKKFWPVAIIFVGLSVILGPGKRIKKKDGAEDKENYISGFALFSGLERNIRSKSLRGGSITALFGGAEIDLRDASLSPEGAVLDLTALFGGIDIKVPENWNVEINSTALFGGIGNKARNESTAEENPLVINATAIFGGVEIKN
ncbi:MAG: DUF5668 domain-containing protein [Acidobacteriota bacterium]